MDEDAGDTDDLAWRLLSRGAQRPASVNTDFRGIIHRLGMILTLHRPSGRAFVAAGMVVLGGPAVAQTLGPASPADTLKQRTQELDALRGQQKQSAETTEKLQREIDAIGEDRRKLNASLIETAGRVRLIEERIANTEARLRPLDGADRTLRTSLDSRRAVIAEVLAALQRMGHRPPPAILVRPEDALESVRTAILLGAVLPDMRSEAEALATDLTKLVRVRGEITTEREKLASDLAALSQDRTRIDGTACERQDGQH